MSVSLFCQLSEPLVEGTEYLGNMILTLNLQMAYMLSADTAIAWVGDQATAASIVLKGKIDLTDSLSAVYSLGEDVPSKFLEIMITSNQFQSEISEIVRKMYLGKDSLLSFRNLSIVIRYPSRSLALEGYQLFVGVLFGLEGVKSIDIVPISEHTTLECDWLSETSFSENVDRLKKAQQTLRGVVQDALSLWKDQPIIIEVHNCQYHATAINSQNIFVNTSMDVLDKSLLQKKFDPLGSLRIIREKIIIVCPTPCDADILTRNKTIELAGGTIIVTSNTSDKSTAKKVVVSLGIPTESVVYDAVRSEKDLADSNIQDLRIDAESLLGGRCDTCTALFDVKKVERNEENQPNITPELTTLTLDLKSYVIANYFKLLVKWGTEIELSRTTVVNNTDGDTSLCNFYPLWGEDLSGVDENEKNLCSLSIILDNKAKDYSLVISSSSSLAAERRMRRINDLAVTATLMRDAAAMINWCPQHREALNESNMLREVLNKTKAAVLFHESADRIISADVVALTVEDRKVVFVFLAALVPQQTIWSVPQNCVSDYTIAEWGELRKTFAVKLDVKGSEKRSLKGLSNSQKSTKSLKVWGFEPAMNEALKFILATAPAASFLGPSPTNRKPIVLEPSTSRIFKHALDFRRDGQNSDSSQRGIEFNSTGFINEGALDWEIAQNERKLFQGHFTFLDREAGMLYQAFEKYFKAFIYQSFRIIMRDSESTAADSIQSVAADETNGMECPTFLQGQHRTPALKIEFSGSSKKDVYSVRVYLEKISTSNLARQQIHFPRYDAARYRELYNNKTKQEASIRMMRREPPQWVCSDLSSFSEPDNLKENKVNRNRKGRNSFDPKTTDREMSILPGDIIRDPLQSQGFINIRIRPPLHSRGIRRMTFPADITITICSPINTESQLTDYNNMCSHFASMDSHYISASIEIPLTSELAKQITVRTTRDDFIARHCLVSLRWDENSLRKDSYNSTNHSLSSFSMDDISTSGVKESFPRVRSSSESRREDCPQLGVAKLWATRVQTMRSALDLLCSAGGVVTSISMGDNFHDEDSSVDGHKNPLDMLSLSAALSPSASLTTPTVRPLKVQPVLRAAPPVLQLLPNTVIEKDYTAASSLYIALPTLSGTIDTPQGPKDIKFEGSQMQHYLNTPPTYSAFPVLRAEISEPSQTRLLPPQDLSTRVSENSASPFDFCVPVYTTDSVCLSQETPSLQSSGTIESLTKQNQAAKDAIKFKEVDYNFHQSINNQKPILQPVAQRVLNPQFDPSIYVPAPSLYNRPKNLLTNVLDFHASQQSPAVHERYATTQRSSFQNFDGTATRIKAAPGLTLPTDWDELFQKVENRTPPSSNIPRAMAPSPTSINFSNQHSGIPTNRFSPKSNIENKQTFSFSGFNPHAPVRSAVSPPSCAFTAVSSKDRGLITAARCNEDNNQESRPFQISAPLQDLHYFTNNSETLQNETAVSQANTQARRGSGTYRDGGTYREAGTYSNSVSPARRLSLGVVNTAESSLRLGGLYGVESSANRNLHHNETSLPFDAGQFLYISQQLQQQQQQQLRSQHNMAISRIVVHWPHPSLRFMFLGDPLKYQLGDMLHRIRSKGIGVVTPVREKSSPSACLLIEGNHQAVAAANAHINAYFRSVIQSVRNVKMILTSAQREILTSADLTRMKEIQGSAGAHIILDPHLDDLSESLSCFDIRLPFSDIPVRGTSGFSTKIDVINISPSGEIIPLIAVRVVSLSGHKIDISVVPNKLSTIGLPDETSWSVDSHLMLIDSNKASDFTDEERAKISKGQILVHQSSKTIIRVWPKCATLNKNASLRSGSFDVADVLSNNTGPYSRINSNPSFGQEDLEYDAQYQARALIDAISEGLLAAESMNLARIALICPAGNMFLFALSADLIRTITVETAVSFLKNGHLHSLQRVVCVDQSPANMDHITGPDYLLSSLKPTANAPARATNLSIHASLDTNHAQLKPITCNNEASLQPGGGNHMALTLLLLLEQANFDYQNNYGTEPYNQGFDSAVGQQGAQNFFGGGRRANLRSLELRSPAIHLIICNVPLPYTLSAEAVCPAILLAQQQQFRRSRESTYSGLGFESYMPYQVNQTRDQYHHDHGLDGPCVVVVKGLPVGILRAVRAIKNLVVNRLLLPQSG